MAVTDVFYDQGGAVYNVKAYGAAGDGSTNDTLAIQAAIDAASRTQPNPSLDTATSGRGSIVYFPHGVYIIRDTLHFPSGVGVRGAGMRTTQLRFEMAETKDGLVWDLGTVVAGQFRVAGFLEDIDLMAYNRDTTTQTARDLVVVNQFTEFALHRVRLYAAKRNNLRLHNCLDVTAVGLLSQHAGNTNLLMGADAPGGTTTSRWVGCYFQYSQDGPGVDVIGLGHVFEGCVFESSGARTPASGYGALVRWGTVTFVAPYFEGNRQFDLVAGTDYDPNAPQSGIRTSVTVVNPTIVYDSNVKQSGAGGVRFVSGTATVLGGNYGTTPYPLVFSQTMDHVTVLARTFPNQPTVEGGGSIDQLPGLVVYTDPATGDQILTGRQGHRIGGGTFIRKHLSATDAWTPGTIANGAVATKALTVAGAQAGDTVVASFNHGGQGLGGKVLVVGSVSAPNTVTVTLLNHYGSTLTLNAGTVRADVWQH